MSIFVASFNYTISDFDQLNPAQAFSILAKKKELDSHNRYFFQDEMRTHTFFMVKTSAADSKRISTPEHLYRLPFDNVQPKQDQSFKIDDGWKKIIESESGFNLS